MVGAPVEVRRAIAGARTAARTGGEPAVARRPREASS
jgi:hypothetical protein